MPPLTTLPQSHTRDDTSFQWNVQLLQEKFFKKFSGGWAALLIKAPQHFCVLPYNQQQEAGLETSESDE
jgi:hypothetical protein